MKNLCSELQRRAFLFMIGLDFNYAAVMVPVRKCTHFWGELGCMLECLSSRVLSAWQTGNWASHSGAGEQMSLTDWESLRPSYIAAIQTQQSQFGHKRQSNLKPLDLSYWYGPKYSDTSLYLPTTKNHFISNSVNTALIDLWIPF